MSPRSLSEIAARHVPYFFMFPFEHFPISIFLCPMPYAPASLREQTLALPISVRVPRLLQQEAWGMGIPATPPRTDVGLPIPFKIQNSKFKIQNAACERAQLAGVARELCVGESCALRMWHL